MLNTALWVVGWLALGVFVLTAIKLPYALRKSAESAPSHQQVRLVQALTCIWLLLAVAHCVTLFIYRGQPGLEGRNGTATFMWWAAANMVPATQVSIQVRAFSEKAIRALLVIAIVVNAALLAEWPLLPKVASVSLQSISETTLVVAAHAIVALGVFVWVVAWRPQHAK